jgi:seryl-tRNA synthetase
MKLYELTQTYQTILDLDIDQESLETALESLNDTLEEKANSIGKVISQLNAESAAYKTEIDRLNAKKKQSESKVESLKEYLDFAFKSMNVSKLETPLYKFSYRKSESVFIDNLEEIQEQYKRTEVVISVDKTSIKSAIKAGLEVKGAHIEEKQNLQIK